MIKLIEPHGSELNGGKLVNLYANQTESERLKILSHTLPSWDLTRRQLCDIELLLNGGFSPLDGFLSQEDYENVVVHSRLSNQMLWPIPITLDVSEAFASTVSTGDDIALRDAEGILIAVMQISDKWIPDKNQEAESVFGNADPAHPDVDYLLNQAGAVYLGGKLNGIEAPTHYDYKSLRDTPAELRKKFLEWGWNKIVAFQTRNPMHRVHQELTFRAAQQVKANLLIQPVVGLTKPGDIDHYSRVRCYQHIITHYPEQTSNLSLLPLAMRMAGPREAVWHAIISKNYGCTHFIVGRDYAGPGTDSSGKEFYGPYDAQALVKKHQKELKIQMVPFKTMVYVEDKAEYHPIDEVKKEEKILNISGTEFRRRLKEGLEIPTWFSYPEVVEELRKAHPPTHQRGFTVFFTGLSGSGKSTIANALHIRLLEMGRMRVTLLDGDIVRKNLSRELGFSKEHRNLNIERIGFVASEITKNGGIAICAPIAPYTKTRKNVRDMISNHGGFIEVYISTSLEICEQRDRKGLYAKARSGLIKEFTGISDPYEEPVNPELTINTNEYSVIEATDQIVLKLEKLGFIKHVAEK